MTSPVKVAQFLDFSGGRWDPSLMFVMGGDFRYMDGFWNFQQMDDLIAYFNEPATWGINVRKDFR